MKRLFSFVAAACFSILLFIFPQAAAVGAAHGIKICKDVLLPSLFPFMIISCFISFCGACEVFALCFLPVTALFKIPKASAGIWISSFVGGFPSGAQSICSLYHIGTLSKTDAENLISCCVCSGPAFLILAVGSQMLGSMNIGIILYLSQVISVMMLTAIFCRSNNVNRFAVSAQYLSFENSLVNAVSHSANSMISIFAFVIFFSVVTEIFKNVIPFPTAFLPFLEVTLGCEYAALMKNGYSILFIAFLCGFGGFSVCFQILSLAKSCDLRPNYYWRIRFLNGLLCSFISGVMMNLFPYHIAAFSPAASSDLLMIWSVDRLLGGVCLACMLMLSMQKLDFNSKS